ncbi:MAG: ribonuclease H-like domain-containing protein [bacterium]
MDIKEKLRLLESLPRYKGLTTTQRTPENGASNIEQVIGGQSVENAFGSFFCYEKNHPKEFVHGGVEVAGFLDLDPSLLSLIAKTPACEQAALDRALFIDTETTGLSGGAGVCAFLVGVGYFVEKEFRITQFFMNDFDEENALLYQLNELLKSFLLVITYNGKSFDAPLLNSRNVYNRIKSTLAELPHLDLLHTVRRLWKHKLLDCSLTTAETQLLNIFREGDIPGYLIPERYFDYLDRKDASPLKPIFYHNQQDILSMVALAVKAAQVAENPAVECAAVEDVLSVGKIFEDCGKFHRALALYEESVKSTPNSNARGKLLMRTALTHKKLQNWCSAEKAWHDCLASESYHPLPYIELAKYYEHKQRNLKKAKALVDKALAEMDILGALRRNGKWLAHYEDLLSRKQRLLRKLTRRYQHH